MVEHDGFVLITRFELVIPGSLYHVIWFTKQRHVQQLVIKTMFLCTQSTINVSQISNSTLYKNDLLILITFIRSKQR